MTAADILELPRSRVRYACYRARTHAENGPPAEAEHLPVIGYFESHEWFLGWSEFGRTWDVGAEGEHARIVRRKMTEEQEWNALLAGLVVDLSPSDVPDA